MSFEVTDPNSLFSAPVLRVNLSSMALSFFAIASMFDFSLAARAMMPDFSCSRRRTFFSVASTARFRGSR